MFKSTFLKQKHSIWAPILSLFISLLGGQLYAQKGSTVTGVIFNEATNEPLTGATIIEKGTSNGVITNADGGFSLELSTDNAILFVRYFGFDSQEVPVNGGTNFTIQLKESATVLDEVVVVGYGTARRADLTGSIASLNSDALEIQPIAEVAEALTGRLAGVQVATSDGSPDADIKITVRGAGSITQNTDPLIIVDGFPIDNLTDISPTDIRTISVLKDASATAIYGSRGANGVIIITTKSGASGKVSVNFNAFYGVKTVRKLVDVLSPEDYVRFNYEMALLDSEPDENGRVDLGAYERFFGPYSDVDQYAGFSGNNWQKVVFDRPGEVISSDLSVRGGTEKLNFNFNYALYDLKANMISSEYQRQNVSLGLKSEVNDRINLAFRIRFANTEIPGGGAVSMRNAVTYSPIPLPGLTEPFDDTDPDEIARQTNPIQTTLENERLQLRRNFNMAGSFSWEIVDNLTLRSDVGFDFRNRLDDRFYGPNTSYSRNRAQAEYQGFPALVINDNKRDRFRNANTLEYDFKGLLGSEHSLKLLGGQEYIVTKTQNLESEVQGFPLNFTFDEVQKLTTQGVALATDNFFSPDDKLFSFFTRANYSFRNRYLFTGTFRADGSSKFLGKNRWGYFPSAAFAWIISEEGFLSGSSWVDFLKLRLSYGEAGNNNIPPGQTVQSFRSSVTTYINDVSSIWITENTLANPDLKWETAITQNIGLDFGLFNSKVSGAIELYRNLSRDLLLRFPLPGTGFDNQFRNIGEIQNTGIEASVNYSVMSKADRRLDLSFNIGINRNLVNSLGELEDIRAFSNWASTEIPPDYRVFVGQPLGIMYGYMNDGRYEVSDFSYDPLSQEYILKDGVVDSDPVVGTIRPGSLKLKDISGPDGVPDGIVDVNDNTAIGNATPDFVGGFILNGFYKGFDLTAALNFSYGFDVYNADKIQYTTTKGELYANMSTLMAEGNRWTNLDPVSGTLITDPAKLEAANANTSLWFPEMSRRVFSDWAVEDGSFVRLNTLSLGYTIPEAAIRSISKLRFYVTGTNLFVLTNYTGSDPEVSTVTGTSLTPNIDASAYPRGRQLVFGINLSF